ncbi:hypothetical protein CDAR_489561 [Caerostris darwini]|uniref:Uncharacterized protein n=1 Tax=Caerostris darwini TaxID=1538125 RepID=A0AAV4P6P7_9ARAC|nr:hypothetical protein CDAR_489561 [Caerostris darwini]
MRSDYVSASVCHSCLLSQWRKEDTLLRKLGSLAQNNLLLLCRSPAAASWKNSNLRVPTMTPFWNLLD